MVNAIIKDKKILCGKCLNRLADIKELGKGTKLEIKCTARKNSVNCGAINQIEL